MPVRGLLEPLTKKIPWAAIGRYFSCSTQEQDCLTVSLECHDTVNTIGAEDAELAFVITAEVDEAATALTSAG